MLKCPPICGGHPLESPPSGTRASDRSGRPRSATRWSRASFPDPDPGRHARDPGNPRLGAERVRLRRRREPPEGDSTTWKRAPTSSRSMRPTSATQPPWRTSPVTDPGLRGRGPPGRAPRGCSRPRRPGPSRLRASKPGWTPSSTAPGSPKPMTSSSFLKHGTTLVATSQSLSPRLDPWCPAAHPSSSRESRGPRRTCAGSSRSPPLGMKFTVGSDSRHGNLPRAGDSRGAGADSAEAISACTRQAAGGIADRTGTIEAGKVAIYHRQPEDPTRDALRLRRVHCDEGRRAPGPELDLGVPSRSPGVPTRLLRRIRLRGRIQAHTRSRTEREERDHAQARTVCR